MINKVNKPLAAGSTGAMQLSFEVQIGTRIRGSTAPMHLGRKGRALCAPLLVSPVISRVAPRQTK
jgi:hypothetical protein